MGADTAASILSYHQDRVANESFLATAQLRTALSPQPVCVYHAGAPQRPVEADCTAKPASCDFVVTFDAIEVHQLPHDVQNDYRLLRS